MKKKFKYILNNVYKDEDTLERNYYILIEFKYW